MEPSAAKRLWHVVRVMYYMLRKGLSKRKLMMELHLLLKRSKIAGKALGNFMTFHHHHHHHHDEGNGDGDGEDGGGVGTAPYLAFSCRSMDPNLFYNPKEVEFSCTNTPSYPSFPTAKRKHRHHHGGGRHDSFSYDAATIAKAFEILNEVSDVESTLASPSPMPAWSVGRSPAVVRQLRITDSPFPIREEEEEGGAGGHVDRQAEEFIKKFYEQLRLQQLQSAAATPDCRFRRTPLLGRA